MDEPFSVSTESPDYVYMKLSGTLSSANYAALQAAVDGAKQEVKRLALERKSMQKVLFDISEFTGTYNVEAMSAMKGLADHNRPYVGKTAVFGGSDIARMAAEITIQLISQPTIKMFKNKEEALLWLLK